jgi:cephalosporin-C deacetylase-like acetyl esterase
MRLLPALLVACSAVGSVAADFKDVDPNVFPKDDPRAKELPRMMWNDAQKRMQEASLRESKAFAEVNTKEQWEQFRNTRIQKLKESLGTFPEVPKDMRIKVTRELDGDGFIIQCIVYESRPGLWVSANLYLPKANPDRKVGGMPGIIISHSHHTPKTQGELQDMGMTWARSGVAVLVPDHLGHGERRQHDFVTEKDYAKPFRVSRQDYYFRYNSNLQLSAAGESLMGWMVWDLMRGVDVLLKQKNIDKDRIILLGAVAGGGDVAGVTATLDERIKCVVPYNFGGWQPESNVLENPDRDAPWFGEGYWESTRGLKNGARDGFAHYVIVGSVAPRPVIYAHEFAWDGDKDPAWPRLQKIFDFYGAKDKLVSIHGKGSVKGQAGPDNTHCTHIGAVHRKGIYPALEKWFGMPVPEEYSKRRPASELMCWTEEVKKELKPKKLHELLPQLAYKRGVARNEPLLGRQRADVFAWQQKEWAKQLGNVEPFANPKVTAGKTEDVPGGTLTRFVLEMEPGIVVPLLLLAPKDAKEKVPVVVMVAQGGKASFLKEREVVLAAFLKAGVAVCLPDVRGTGETRAGASAERGSARTSVSQTNLILGQTVLGSQLRDLRTVIRWLAARDELDGTKIGVWGDSFAKVNSGDVKAAVPLDADNLPVPSEPGGAELASLAGMYEKVAAVYRHGAINISLLKSAYLYCPHDALVPGMFVTGGRFVHAHAERSGGWVDGHNRSDDEPISFPETVKWMLKELNK